MGRANKCRDTQMTIQQPKAKLIKVIRIGLYMFLCVGVIIIVFDKYIYYRTVQEYRQCEKRLKIELEADDRFRNVRVLFYPTRPSLSILAPANLPEEAKADLGHLVSSVFTHLPTSIYYKD